MAPTIPDRDTALAVRMNLGLLLWDRHEFPEAARLFLEATQLCPLGPDPRSQMANEYAARSLLVLGRPREAAELWQNGMAWEPNRSQAWYALGLARSQAGQPMEAARAFRKSLALAPTGNPAQERLQALPKP